MTPPNDVNNMLYTNAEEEVFIPECDLVLDISEGGDGARSFATLSQVQSQPFKSGAEP
jgi:hypothetical protein